MIRVNGIGRRSRGAGIIFARFGVVHGVSGQVSAQYERARRVCAGLLIIALPTADLGKPGTGVKPPGWRILFVDFQIDRTHAESCESSQVEIEQPARQPASTPSRRHRHRQDFGFVHCNSRQDESHHHATGERTVAEDVIVKQ